MDEYWSPNTSHKFDLSGMNAGDIFIGCNKCGWRLDAGVKAAGYCPQCNAALSVFRVAPSDLLTADSETVGGVQ